MKPILVTGGPRTGTTWVGKILSQPNTVRYVHEPFNLSAPACSCGYKVNHWFEYITKDNEAVAYSHFKHVLGSPINLFLLRNSLMNAMRAKRLRTIVEFISAFITNRPVIKAPSAVFSAKWLASVFNLRIVIMIRHPAAFAYSYKKLNWSHDFSDFLKQPDLIRDYLYPFKEEIEKYASQEYKIIEQAALLWKLIYHVVEIYRETQSDWIFVRHEDLSLNPLEGFQEIYEKTGLEFSNKVRRGIEEKSSLRNPVETTDPYSIQRSSQRIVGYWKDRLTSAEIRKICEIVEGTSSAFYTAAEW